MPYEWIIFFTTFLNLKSSNLKFFVGILFQEYHYEIWLWTRDVPESILDSDNQRDGEITHDPLLFSVSQGIFRGSHAVHYIKQRGKRGVSTLVLCSLAITTVMSCIDASVRFVTKFPKVGPLLTYILHLSGDNWNPLWVIGRPHLAAEIDEVCVRVVDGEHDAVGRVQLNHHWTKQIIYTVMLLVWVADPDPYWIRIQSGQWIRIPIGSGFNQVSGSGSVFGIRIQEGKNDPQKKKKFRNLMFWSVGCSLLRAEGFFCYLEVLYGGLGIGKL